MASWRIIRFAALATLSLALMASPSFTLAFAAGGGGGSVGGGEPPPSARGSKATHTPKAKKGSQKQSRIGGPPHLLRVTARLTQRSMTAVTMPLQLSS